MNIAEGSILRGEANAYHTAANLLAILAYPKDCDWTPRGKAQAFRKALHGITLDVQITKHGLKSVRMINNNPKIKKTKRERLHKTLMAGYRRIKVRLAVAAIYESREWHTVHNDTNVVIHNIRPISETIRKALKTNTLSGFYGDWNIGIRKKEPDNSNLELGLYEDEKILNIQRRQIKDSIPVLNLAVAFRGFSNPWRLAELPYETYITIWDYLNIFLIEAEKWVEKTIETANHLRNSAGAIIENHYVGESSTIHQFLPQFKNNNNLEIQELIPYRGIFSDFKPNDFIYFDIKITPIMTSEHQ